jgi:hypothetical protein
MNKIVLQTIPFLLYLVLTTSFKANGQTIYVLDGNDTLKTNNIGIKINLLLKDKQLNLKIGQNKLTDINPKDCRAIQLIYSTDTLNFWEIVQYEEGTNAMLLDIMKNSEPDYNLILNTDWTIIIDKNPFKNKDIIALLENMPESKEKDKSIVAMKTFEYMWAFIDSNKH